jgi:hypothetical protein
MTSWAERIRRLQRGKKYTPPLAAWVESQYNRMIQEEEIYKRQKDEKENYKKDS